MIKLFLQVFVFLVSFSLLAQPPAGYYDSAQGLSGYALKTELSAITGQGYISHTYGDLWTAFYTTDIDSYYENDGTILDVYSEKPVGTDPYEFILGQEQCGNYSGEGDCYNREHLVPQSWFNKAYPMKADIHHIFPTDGYVNGRRGNLPFGEVTNPDYTSDNGSLKGPNAFSYPTAYTGEVFEPIDEFKGDIARAYFYMATRYESQIASWANESATSQQVLNGTSDQVFTDWTLALLLQWDAEDPVSQREIDRNNAAYAFQGNRNPFVDHPEYVNLIWGNATTPPDATDVLLSENFNDCTSIATHFVAISELSAVNWECINQYGQNNSGAMQMNAFVNGNQVPSIDWLISADPINFDDFTAEKLSFYLAATFGNTPLQVLYSTDYDGSNSPSNFTWQAVPNLQIPLYPSTASGVVDSTYTDIDLSSIVGPTVYLAFKYDNSTGQAATRWTLDNVKLIGTETMSTPAPKPMEVSIYPNPISYGDVTIQFVEQKNATITIYNLTGKVVRKTHQKGLQTQLSTDQMAPGVYMIRLESGNQSVVKKLIIQ